MTADKFFKLVQRTNAVLLLVAGIGGVLLIGGFLWDVFGGWPSAGSGVGVVEGPDERMEDSSLYLGSFDRAYGTDFMMAPLRSPGRSMSFSSGEGYSPIRNFLFLDLLTFETHWLFENHSSLVSWQTVVNVGDVGAGTRRALAMVYLVVTEDSDGDGSLTRRDSGVLAVSDPTGRSYRELVRGIEGVRGVELVGGDVGAVFYRANGAMHVARIDFSTLSVQRALDLSALPEVDRLPRGRERQERRK